MNFPPGFRFYKELIREVAQKHGVEPALLAAVVWQESAFNADGFKHEPDFWNRYLKANPKYRHLNPRRVSSSYGLAQVMYCRLLEDKLAENDAWAPELLFIPEYGLDLGCGLLKELLEWADTRTVPLNVHTTSVEIALAAYNGGKGGNDPYKNWPLRNASYAKAVLAKKALLEKEYAILERPHP